MIERLVIINKDGWKKMSRVVDTVREIRSLFRCLRDGRYDMVIDLQGLLRSGLITISTGAPVRVGFAAAREGSTLFYNWKVGTQRDMHAVERYLKVAGVFGCDNGNVIFPLPHPETESDTVKSVRETLGHYAVLVPGARWETKIWPAENFGRLASMLPLKSVIVGGGKDIPIADRIITMAGKKAVSLAGRTTLPDLVEIMRGARLAVSNDSGPMHIAAALNVPVVAVFGPTSPERTGPYGKGHVIIRSELKCSPCFRKECRDFRCMEGISPEEVFERIRGLLSAGPRR